MERLLPGEFGIALGNELANAMGVQVGDKVTLVVPQGTITPAGVLPRLKQFTVVGVFSSGHFEFDNALALINIRDAEAMFRLAGPTGVRLKLTDMQRAPGGRRTGRHARASSTCGTGPSRTATGLPLCRPRSA